MRIGLLSIVLVGAALCSTTFASKIEAQQSDEEIFNIVSSKLDKGGSYYSIQNTKYFFSYLENGLQVGANLLNVIPKTGQFGGIPPMMIVNSIKTIAKESGVNEVLACGMSSVLINPKVKEPFFQNKIFLYHGNKKPKGFLWTLVAPANKELTDLYRLPKNTISAFSVDIAPGKFWSAIKQLCSQLAVPPVKMLPMLAEMQFAKKYKLQLPLVLESLSGSWFGLVVSTKAADGKPALQGMLEIPAKSAVFFDLLKKSIKNNPNAIVALDKITFKADKKQPEWIAPFISMSDKKLYFVSSPKILESTKEAMTKRNGLVTTAEFKHFNQRMPEQGIAFLYRSPRIHTVIVEMVKAYAPKPVAAKSAMFNSIIATIANETLFTIVTRTEDGVLVYSNSPTCIVANASLTPVATTAILAGMLLPALNQAREKARRISCMSNLKQIGLSLKQYQYAMDHKDIFPPKNNSAGLNALVKEDYLTDFGVYKCPSSKFHKGRGALKEVNSAYIYFGGLKEEMNPLLPLAFDKPGNHKGYINVLFLDAHAKGFNLNYSTCQQVVRFLNRRNKYKPEEFNMLLQKAQKIDRKLNYK